MAVEGQIQYTSRAFEQDADLAMGTDIVRALVELITNADDAYGERPGTITVEVLINPGDATRVRVIDNAKGLTVEELRNCFGTLGGQQSGFHDGARVRGLLGRGAKDTAAFGKVTFHAIKNGQLATFELHRNGKYRLSDATPATAINRSLLGIPGDASGLVAEVFIEKQGVAVPRLSDLAERIGSQVQLRDITLRREVVVREVKNGGAGRSRPAKWEQADGEVVINETITIGDDGVRAQLKVWKLREVSSGRCDPYSRHGLVVKGTHASYSNEFFGESSPETQWLHGEVICEHIDTLIRSYDEEAGQDPGNPSRLLRRDRDGLADSHPFYIELRRAVLLRLAGLLESLKPSRATTGGGDALQRDLDRARDAVSRLFEEDLQRIEETDASGGLTPSPEIPIKLVPNRLSVRPGHARTVTVLIATHLASHPDELTITSSDPTVATVDEMEPFLVHQDFADTLISRFRVTGHQLGQCRLVVTREDASATCVINVIDLAAEDVEAPAQLEFANQKMSVTVGKTRSVTLRAPVELGPNGTLEVTLSLEGTTCTLIGTRVTLSLIKAGWLEGKARVAGTSLGAACAISAFASEQTATGELRTTEPQGLFGSNLTFDVLDETRGATSGFLRATDTGFCVEIYARHVGLAPLLGRRRADGSWTREGEADTRLAIYGVMASTLADWLIRRDASRFSHKFPDADAVLQERATLVTRYMGQLVHLIGADRG